ncbi:hypothetical protein F3Y22_tig00117034pilonHSYRG01555 [Hibiscus syriacus]|uniref:Reverse transcriptase zinc-binding domain-containing protein n=1 Tax=Hibiscus syriacus TaxID=106335 RepID=A0A6A2WH28_HIBSY|nr:hypothetical protein F3Y22_tig00117034pilonHSYRG01555 [Hibiscus syriacus]
MPLKFSFPRLYRLAKDKYAKLEDVAVGNKLLSIQWVNIFSRKLLDREVSSLKCFEDCVKDIVVVLEIEDKILWVHDKGVHFSVKTLSNLLVNNDNEDSMFNFDLLWKLKVPPKVRSFLWLLAIDRLPTKDFLLKKGVLKRSDQGCEARATLPTQKSPPNDHLEFVLAGVTLPDSAGCGGFLRCVDGSFRAMFSGPVTPQGIEDVEAMMISVALGFDNSETRSIGQAEKNVAASHVDEEIFSQEDNYRSTCLLLLIV